jgi:hypothetical protein
VRTRSHAASVQKRKTTAPWLLGSAIESLVHLKQLIIDSSPWRIADGLDDLAFVSTYFS